ncbi:cytochrome o ubiquinol oxidase subunit IV [Cupriavidus pauculus]|uniref:cytochrome o ubiquinol oxidase subunit IV n=1 Tax=Cupriavidus pauculus TaxID=82633 RepID=UPI0007851BDB|nr:cytochrome o ubiquinol oxidase subunit IV [Cupriavidus pauculus]KAB0603720.1 cytochrome o ubiquinol oxidase subunit IV [Cupriavidus pauculus]MBY4733058.1 cytochrome o ubiquinol oxidase subunit IV [Cupriavidus pauculus]MCM3607652.1 cytochrome o ubiquinol oxidase subunit IV [Cupriavidus pauculus]UAL03459.1 cytochrome o ubiquinol oxidase subunit IV [Cupriavidus pauculus]
MSTTHHTSHDHAHGTLRSHLVGYALSLLLTFVSFGAVMGKVLPARAGLALIVALCIAQLLVQLVFFLHLGPRKGQRGNTGIFLCTVFLIAIVVAGSLWVMHNANLNMMPMQSAPAGAGARP